MSGRVYAFNRPEDRFALVSHNLTRDTELSHPGFRIIVYVSGHAETFRLTQAAIGQALGMDRGTVARHLRHLESLGYLARVRNFTAAGRQADDLYVSQTRRTADEWADALQTQCGKSPQCKTPRGETPQRKKNNSKKNKDQEEQPSGGTTANAAPVAEPESVEDDVKLKTTEDAPTLFDVPAPPSPPAEPSSKDVVAAYVDSFRATHEREPLKRDVGRVARESKGLLDQAEATVDELVDCARAMGTGTFSNIGMQLKISRDRRPARPSSASTSLPILDGDDRWASLLDDTERQAADLADAFDGSWGEGVPA